MAKLTVYHAIFVPTEVEVPDECPDCGASMHIGQGHNLVEWDWNECQIAGGLQPGPGIGDLVFEGGGGNEAGDTYHAAELVCLCGHVFGGGGSYVFPKDQPQTAMNLAIALEECRG